MKDKIISKASDLFLKLGFKSVTMDDLASEMCISKKTIYKYFCNKEALIEESTSLVHDAIHKSIDTIIEQNHNAIQENFEIRNMFKEMFQSSDTSPLYQLKKHYPEIHEKVMSREIQDCAMCFKQNIEKGIAQGLYRGDLDLDTYVKFYYILISNINENIASEIEARKLELEALEYHTRAMATPKGIVELEKQILKNNI
jgi:AcrR family transcriptional regulator